MFCRRRRAGERSDGGQRGCVTPLKMRQDLFDHRRIFDASDHFHRTAAVFAGQEVDLDQIAWSDLEQPQAGPQGGGQDARSNPRRLQLNATSRSA